MNEQNFDLQQFENSVAKLLSRHLVLSQYFIEQKGKWLAKRQSDLSVEIAYQDLANLRNKEQKTQLQKMEQTLHQKIDIHKAPLFAFAIAYLGNNRLQLILVVHHLLTDGVGLSLFLKELSEFHHNPNLRPERVDTDYRRYVSEMEYLASKDLGQELEFWLRQIPKQKMILPGKQTKRENDFASQKEYRVKYSIKQFSNNKSRDMFGNLVIALYRFLAKWTNHANPVIAHRIHRRDIDSQNQYHSTIGWFAGDIVLTLPSKTVNRQRQAFTELWKQITLGGVGYEILANRGSIPYAHEITPVRFNYQPRTIFAHNLQSDTYLFSPPEQKRLYLLDVIARVEQNQLRIIVRYSKHFHTKKMIEQFITEWIKIAFFAK